MIVSQNTKWLLNHWRWLGRERGWEYAWRDIQHRIWLLRKQYTPHRLHWSAR